MSRWRPPVERGSPYITAAGYRALEAELATIWKRRREVVKHLAAAAAEGDRSENAEYHYRKRELAGIDRRIRYLQRRMPELNVVVAPPSDPRRIFFGAAVELVDETGIVSVYRIVGGDEIDAARGWISIDSPVAKALLKHTSGDEVTVRTAAGASTYVIVDVRYTDPRLYPDAP
jgi:transcription elongation factor GreB